MGVIRRASTRPHSSPDDAEPIAHAPAEQVNRGSSTSKRVCVFRRGGRFGMAWLQHTDLSIGSYGCTRLACPSGSGAPTPTRQWGTSPGVEDGPISPDGRIAVRFRDGHMNEKQIGERIRVARGDITQAKLAADMRARGFSWSQVTVWKVETGERRVKLSEAPALAEVLSTTVSYLAGVPNENGDAAAQRLAEMNSRLHAIQEIIRGDLSGASAKLADEYVKLR